ncbi:MAG: GNAT family N-acetyltransferase [Alphaproteobacteria bacterium]|nr:GNAT family N-acetyltransferase [Alphaproteobacteria bacterium]
MTALHQSPVNVAALEAISAASWPARHTSEVDGWLLRFTDGYTHRGNSAATHRFTGADVEESIDAVEGAYRAKALPALFHMSPATVPADLEQRLIARGYECTTPTMVCVANTLDMIARLPEPFDVSGERGAGFDSLVIGGSRSPDDGHERLDILARMNPPLICATAFDNGVAVSCGIGIAREGWAGINLMRTDAHARRRGNAQRVLSAIAQWARASGIANIYLGVEQQNAPARALYAKAGFRDAYPYWYLRKTV